MNSIYQFLDQERISMLDSQTANLYYYLNSAILVLKCRAPAGVSCRICLGNVFGESFVHFFV